MKKVKSLFTPKKLVIWIAIILLFFTLPTINKPAMSETQAIVTMLCLDKDEDKIKAVVTVLSPGQDKQAKYEVFSATGDTLASTVDSIALSIGKEMGFAQCEIMAIGEKLSEDNIMKTLDYMTRTKKVGTNAILTYFEGDIEEFAKSITTLAMEKSLKLEKIINFDKEYILAQDSNIESFYKGFFSDVSIGIMPKIELTGEQKSNAIEVSSSSGGSSSGGSTSSSGSASSGGSQEGSSGEKKYIVTNGSTVVFKHGKKYYELSPSEVQKVNLFTNSSDKGTLIVEGITDHVYDNAKVVVDILEKDSKIKVSFDGDTPVYSVDVNLIVFIEEVIQDEPTDKFLIRHQDFFTDALVEKLKEKVLSNLNEAVELCKSENMDIINLYKAFNRKQYKNFRAYLERVGIDNYLQGVRFDFNVEINNEY